MELLKPYKYKENKHKNGFKDETDSINNNMEAIKNKEAIINLCLCSTFLRRIP